MATDFLINGYSNGSNGHNGSNGSNGNGHGDRTVSLQPRVMIVGQDVGIVESVRESLNGAGYQLALFERVEDAYAYATRQLPNLAIIDVGLAASGGQSLLQRLHQDPATHYLPVLLLTAQGENPGSIAGFQFGLDDYLTKPVASADLTFRVKSHIARNAGPAIAPSPEREGKIIASFGTKGGVGKTMVAVNLAAALARRTGGKVVLVDADLFLGEVALHFNMTPKLTVLNLIDHMHDLDDYLVNQVLMTHSSGVRLMLSPVAPEEAERVTALDLGRLMDFLKSRFDYVVVDCTPSYGERNLTILERAEAILLLVTPDVGSLKNMGVFFNVAYRIGLPNGRIHVVLNRADSKSGIDAAEIEKSFKRKVEYRIPSGGLAPTLSVNRGEPLALKNPNHPISQVFYKMAESLQMSVPVKKG